MTSKSPDQTLLEAHNLNRWAAKNPDQLLWPLIIEIKSSEMFWVILGPPYTKGLEGDGEGGSLILIPLSLCLEDAYIKSQPPTKPKGL